MNWYGIKICDQRPKPLRARLFQIDAGIIRRAISHGTIEDIAERMKSVIPMDGSLYPFANGDIFLPKLTQDSKYILGEDGSCKCVPVDDVWQFAVLSKAFDAMPEGGGVFPVNEEIIK